MTSRLLAFRLDRAIKIILVAKSLSLVALKQTEEKSRLLDMRSVGSRRASNYRVLSRTSLAGAKG